jgi:hypothetical protein
MTTQKLTGVTHLLFLITMFACLCHMKSDTTESKEILQMF